MAKHALLIEDSEICPIRNMAKHRLYEHIVLMTHNTADGARMVERFSVVSTSDSFKITFKVFFFFCHISSPRWLDYLKCKFKVFVRFYILSSLLSVHTFISVIAFTMLRH